MGWEHPFTAISIIVGSSTDTFTCQNLAGIIIKLNQVVGSPELFTQDSCGWGRVVDLPGGLGRPNFFVSLLQIYIKNTDMYRAKCGIFHIAL